MGPKRTSQASRQRSSSVSARTMDQQSSTFRYRPSSSWTPANDALLMRARREGAGWEMIAKRYFPDKTSNACRKRHERLMERRQNESWDEERLAALARVYMEVRKEMWSLAAVKLGEKWQVLEGKCMEKGLKNLTALSRSHARRGTGSFLGTTEHTSDDSGIAMDDSTETSDVNAEETTPEPEQAESSRSGAERQLQMEQDTRHHGSRPERSILPTPPTTIARVPYAHTATAPTTSHGPSIKSLLANSPTTYHPTHPF